jgi:hypothetical protein
MAEKPIDTGRAGSAEPAWRHPGQVPSLPQQPRGSSMNAHAPIPYTGYHIGPRRTLAMEFRKAWFSPPGVHVNIDGSVYVLPWRSASFEVPADRPVSITTYQSTGSVFGLATTVLPPGPSAGLEYNAQGILGAPGTTRARGRRLVARHWLLAIAVVFGSMILALLLLIIFFGVLAAF